MKTQIKQNPHTYYTDNILFKSRGVEPCRATFAPTPDQDDNEAALACLAPSDDATAQHSVEAGGQG